MKEAVINIDKKSYDSVEKGITIYGLSDIPPYGCMPFLGGKGLQKK